MSKQTSISLHLAKLMRLEGAHLHTYPVVFEGTAKQDVFISEEMGKKRFDPFTNRAQWADVVLWAASHGYDVALHTDTSYCMTPYKVFECSFEWPGSNEQDHIASTLEAIALATGWAP